MTEPAHQGTTEVTKVVMLPRDNAAIARERLHWWTQSSFWRPYEVIGFGTLKRTRNYTSGRDNGYFG
jgi:hypothetical protein